LLEEIPKKEVKTTSLVMKVVNKNRSRDAIEEIDNDLMERIL
jgi:hypothetical protein